MSSTAHQSARSLLREFKFEMNDDEDSIGSWLLSVGIGIVVAAAFVAWPVVAWQIVWSVFK